MSTLLRRGIIQSGGGEQVPSGLQWLTMPPSTTGRGISFNAQTFQATNAGGANVESLEIEFWLEDSSYSNNMVLVGFSGSSISPTSRIMVTGDKTINVRGTDVTFSAAPYSLFDGNFHKIRVYKSAGSISGSTYRIMLVDTYNLLIGVFSSNFSVDYIATSSPEANEFGLKGITRNFKFTTRTGNTTCDMPINDGSGTVINNNGSSSNGNIVNATLGIDYRWNT